MMRSANQYSMRSFRSQTGQGGIGEGCGIEYSATGTLRARGRHRNSNGVRHVPHGKSTPFEYSGRATRTGLTLYEVVLSLTLFLGAMLAIGQIISTGSRAAIQSRLQTQAILRCESKLSELLAGVEPMESISSTQLDEDANWVWSLEIEPGPHEVLMDLTVTVSHLSQDGNPDSSYSLRRLVRDPQLYIDAAEAAAAAEEEAAAAAESAE